MTLRASDRRAPFLHHPPCAQVRSASMTPSGHVASIALQRHHHVNPPDAGHVCVSFGHRCLRCRAAGPLHNRARSLSDTHAPHPAKSCALASFNPVIAFNHTQAPAETLRIPARAETLRIPARGDRPAHPSRPRLRWHWAISGDPDLHDCAQRLAWRRSAPTDARF